MAPRSRALRNSRTFPGQLYSSNARFASAVLDQLGSRAYGEFADTRQRLLTALVETGGDRHMADVEAAKWRVRLEDLLRTKPDVTSAVIDLTGQGFEA